jgi:two-component system, OmpR family, response regulator
MFDYRARVLCLDDNLDTCEMVVTLLDQEGLECTGVNSVSEALQVTIAQRFDLYVLDVQVPDGSGIELCKELRRQDESASIILYSAAAYQNDIDKGMHAGANAYVAKPAIDELIIAVRDVLGLGYQNYRTA